MADHGLLWAEFLENCKKQDLDEELIEKVFEYLMKHQYLPQGSRLGKHIELKRILEQTLEASK
jgi:hypothetical protein